MKTLTVRLPESLIAQIEAESQRRQLSKSDIVREWLTTAGGSQRSQLAMLDSIADIIGSVDQLPRDLSSKKKKYLRSTGMAKSATVDAGFLVALLGSRDANHRWAKEQAYLVPPPWITPEAVFEAR